jgi:hypothetical protein
MSRATAPRRRSHVEMTTEELAQGASSGDLARLTLTKPVPFEARKSKALEDRPIEIANRVARSIRLNRSYSSSHVYEGLHDIKTSAEAADEANHIAKKMGHLAIVSFWLKLAPNASKTRFTTKRMTICFLSPNV